MKIVYMTQEHQAHKIGYKNIKQKKHTLKNTSTPYIKKNTTTINSSTA